MSSSHSAAITSRLTVIFVERSDACRNDGYGSSRSLNQTYDLLRRVDAFKSRVFEWRQILVSKIQQVNHEVVVVELGDLLGPHLFNLSSNTPLSN